MKEGPHKDHRQWSDEGKCVPGDRAWMTDYHDTLREKPSSLFMLLGSSLISIASHPVHATGFWGHSTTVLHWMWWRRLCCIHQQQTYQDGVSGALQPSSQLYIVHLPTLTQNVSVSESGHPSHCLGVLAHPADMVEVAPTKGCCVPLSLHGHSLLAKTNTSPYLDSDWLIAPSLVLLLTRHKLFTSQHTHFSPEDWRSMVLKNMGMYLQVHMAIQPRTTTLSPLHVNQRTKFVRYNYRLRVWI
jgi:hypothetical protein